MRLPAFASSSSDGTVPKAAHRCQTAALPTAGSTERQLAPMRTFDTSARTQNLVSAVLAHPRSRRVIMIFLDWTLPFPVALAICTNPSKTDEMLDVRGAMSVRWSDFDDAATVPRSPTSLYFAFSESNETLSASERHRMRVWPPTLNSSPSCSSATRPRSMKTAGITSAGDVAKHVLKTLTRILSLTIRLESCSIISMACARNPKGVGVPENPASSTGL
mmetsp:Transcript_6803/g.18836  ORF Transcript_6803/g.18836 Transcript_6803/m.18836 type:complete len:219 (+) Transcript_6803:72-728(+)